MSANSWHIHLTDARPVTIQNITELSEWCRGSIKGTKLPPHEQAIDFHSNDVGHRAEVGEWITKDVNGNFARARFQDLLPDYKHLVFNPDYATARYGRIADARRVTFSNMEEIALWCGGNVTVAQLPDYPRGIRFWDESEHRWMFAEANEWIIKDLSGEFFSLPQAQFHLAYQPHWHSAQKRDAARRERP